ncbi:MAG: phosphomannomutase/phosphoglucomutase, partial [Prevotella pallens]|nr:phosphomannomutase/phosphoglucomutase [Prevotella pallens]
FKAYGEQVLEHIKTAAEKEQDWQLVSPNYEGVRIACTGEEEQGWFLLRQSLHDPVLPLNIESNVEGGVNRITERVLNLLSDFKALKQ